MNLRITVLMAIYNCADTVSEAIESLYTQTFQNFKLVLCDDGSTDDTYLIAQQYANKYDNIILLRNDTNKKLAYSLNRCLEYADTEYVARMDGDDISLPKRFETQIHFLDNHPEYALVSTGMIRFDETGDWGVSLLQEKPTKIDFRKGTPHAHAPSMIRTEIIKEVGGYTVDKLLERGQDYYLWYKIYKKGYMGYNIQQPLYKMRDDQKAINRRTVKSRINSFKIKRKVMKELGVRHSLFFALPDIIKIFIPNFIMQIIRKRRMEMKNK